MLELHKNHFHKTKGSLIQVVQISVLISIKQVSCKLCGLWGSCNLLREGRTIETAPATIQTQTASGVTAPHTKCTPNINKDAIALQQTKVNMIV